MPPSLIERLLRLGRAGLSLGGRAWRSLCALAKEHALLALALAFSVALLFLFLVLQHEGARMLSLETRWLIVAGVPLLLGLLAGGYVKRIKGLGVELEARLREPVGKMELVVLDALAELDGHEKRSLQHLENLRPAARKKVERLIFVQGLADYYRGVIVEEYLRLLPSLRFLEIRDEDEHFVCLVKAEAFRSGRRIDAERVRLLLRALAEGNVAQAFGGDAVTAHVAESEDLLAVARAMRTAGHEYLPVLTEAGVFRGIVVRKAIDSRIVDELIEHGPRS